MVYRLYQTQADLVAPVKAAAAVMSALWRFPLIDALNPVLARNLAAAYELLSRTGISHMRPAFGIRSVKVLGRAVDVAEEAAAVLPFATLLHFKKNIEITQPRVLLVAPMSGHFATLVRDTLETMLPEHDVYITDWHNARDVALTDGRFGLDEYVDYLIRFLEVIGPGAHVVAVCQPCVPVLAAVALMSEDRNDATPHSMTLMAGPVDARINPTRVNELAAGHSVEWFEQTLITRVPDGCRGARRRVYPGFTQITAFLSMNLERHLKAHLDLFVHLINGEAGKAQAIRNFYNEYFAVADLPAEFYLETVALIFQQHALARGQLTWRGRRVDPRSIKRTALLTIEGERDDVCGNGQTLAAQALCSSLRPYLKKHHLQPGVGHYGVFSGSRWKKQVYPLIRNVILANTR